MLYIDRCLLDNLHYIICATVLLIIDTLVNNIVDISIEQYFTPGGKMFVCVVYSSLLEDDKKLIHSYRL